MDWSQILGWGSPIGWGAFLIGVGFCLKGIMHKMHYWDKNK